MRIDILTLGGASRGSQSLDQIPLARHIVEDPGDDEVVFVVVADATIKRCEARRVLFGLSLQTGFLGEDMWVVCSVLFEPTIELQPLLIEEGLLPAARQPNARPSEQVQSKEDASTRQLHDAL